MPLTNMIDRVGKTFSIIRSGVNVGTTKGIYDGSKDSFAFPVNADVKVGDTLNSEYGESYLITKIQVLTERGKPHHKEAKCKDQNEIDLAPQQAVFNIGNVSNSVVGNHNTVSFHQTVDSIRKQVEQSGEEDKNELNEIVDLLEKILQNQEPIKQGMFSKFSSVMEKHSWLSGSVMSALLGFLTQCIQ